MLVALYIILGYFFLFFIVGTIIKNNSVVDIGWGLGFVLTAWALFFINGANNLSAILINGMVTLWGLRLFYYILKRNIFAKEDFRYQNWRNAWGKWVIPRAFFQVFMLQGFFMFVIGSTVYYLNVYAQDFNMISIVGIVLWLIGYGFEVIGDYQLKVHMKAHPGELMTSGLWAYTRHPNYFGEAVLWWGIFVFAMLNGAPFYLIVSPFVITYILLKVSTPMLEDRMKLKASWKEYADRTSMFFPKGKGTK